MAFNCHCLSRLIVGLILAGRILFCFGYNVQFQPQSTEPWERPGCHKVGYTRSVTIPDCVEFHITTNACRGYCESWSVPTTLETLLTNPNQLITSVGECCNIMETENIEVRVLCLGGTRDVVFKSARSCACYHCKKM